MNPVRVAAVVLNQTPLDWDGNARRIEEALTRAAEAGAGLVCLPELCVTGYGCEDAFLSEHVWETGRARLNQLLPKTRGLAAAIGLPVLFRRSIYNAVCFAVNGRVAGFAVKQYLAGDGIHYEPRWFKPWPTGVTETIDWEGENVPFGDVFFDLGGVRVGFEICEDAWSSDRPGSRLARQAVDLILNPSASHFSFGKHEVRKRFVLEGSRAFGVGYVYANLNGCESGRAVYDGGALIASRGRLIREGLRFSFQDVQLLLGDVDLSENRMAQAGKAGYRADSAQTDACRSIDWRPPVPPDKPVSGTDTLPVMGKHEEFTRAVALGLFDYARKSRTRGFVVSLSGGADSSAVACLVHAVAGLGLRDLGPEIFSRAFGGTAVFRDARTAVHSLLTCVYQTTAQSSLASRKAAQDLADELGATFHAFDIETIVQSYIALGRKALDRPLTWDGDDIALQNIQARTRGPGVWLLANIQNALLLATSNRSEAAVGYATMDGDTCGSLSPIAGVDKAYIKEWLIWLEKDGLPGFGPFRTLAAVNRAAPTAELRPAAMTQTDEKDLMPYDVLNAIELSAIRDRRSPQEVFDEAARRFSGVHSPTQIREWVSRFYQLWSRNQWKRERYAPSFHLDDENLDPKTWCRFPILSGSYRWELDRLNHSPS